MLRQQWMVIILALAAVAVILAATWLAWEPGNLLGWMETHAGPNTGSRGWFPRHLLDESSDINRAATSLGGLATLLISGILILFAFPAQIRRMEMALSLSPTRLFRHSLLGLLATVLIMVVGAISTLTLGTFPLTIFLGVIAFFALLIGFVTLSYTCGHSLMTRANWGTRSPVASFVLGLLVLYALGQIPYLGILFRILFASTGMGLVIATRFGSGRTWNLSPLFEDEVSKENLAK